jgi:hypothetical protein
MEQAGRRQGGAGMSLWEDYEADWAIADMENEQYSYWQWFYGELPLDELLRKIIGVGASLNIDTFPAYDIALRAYGEDLTLTERQREALINVLSYHMAYGEQRRQ